MCQGIESDLGRPMEQLKGGKETSRTVNRRPNRTVSSREGEVWVERGASKLDGRRVARMPGRA